MQGRAAAGGQLAGSWRAAGGQRSSRGPGLDVILLCSPVTSHSPLQEAVGDVLDGRDVGAHGLGLQTGPLHAGPKLPPRFAVPEKEGRKAYGFT